MRRSKNTSAAWTACAIFSVLLLLCFRLLSATVRQTDRLLPDAYQFSNQYGLGFTFRELASAAGGGRDAGRSAAGGSSASGSSADGIGAGQNDLVAFAQKGTALLQYGEKMQRARLMYVQGDAAGVLGVRMLHGAFLRAQELAPEENHCIVIDDALAQDFFFTPDCVGRTLEIDGTVYTVCGVYEAADGWVADLCGDGLSLVFFPAALSDVRTQRVEHVFLRSSSALFVDSAKDTLAALTGQAPAPAYTGSHGESRSFLRQCVRLVCVAACAAAGVLALVLLAGAVSRQENSGVSLNRRRLLAGGVLLALAGLGCRASAFTLCLPAAWTPPDNIFDVSFYTDQYISAWQAIHSGASNYYLNRCTLIAYGACACLTLLCIVWAVCAAVFGIYAVMRRD